MTEIVFHLKGNTTVSEFLKTDELFKKDVGIIIDDNFRNLNEDHLVSLVSCVVHNRRIPKFLYEKFKDRKIERFSIDNETGALRIYLW